MNQSRNAPLNGAPTHLRQTAHTASRHFKNGQIGLYQRWLSRRPAPRFVRHVGSVALLTAAALTSASPGWTQGMPPGATIENETDFVARCTQETVTANPQAHTWAENACRANWGRVVAAQPIVEAILTATPTDVPETDASRVVDRLIMIEWAAQPTENTVASGVMGDIEVSIENAPGTTLSFRWAAVGLPVPYDVEQALRGRQARLTKVSCQALGPGEVEKVYRVTALERAPFGISIYSREAPTADASSFFNARVDLSGGAPTLADWSPMCPS